MPCSHSHLRTRTSICVSLWSLLIPAFAAVTACGQPAIAPRGIVSNNPCIDSILSHIAAPGQIAAVSHYSHDAASASAPLGWARAIPPIGTSAEEIIAARPRLILTGNLGDSRTTAAIAKAGIKIVGLGVPADVAESDAQIRTVAKAIGRAEAGEALIARIVPPARPAHYRGTAIIWQSSGYVAGTGTLQDEQLRRAGYRNAAASYGLEQWDELPLETLLRHPPDVIFMPVPKQGDGERALRIRATVLRHLKTTRVADFPDKLLFCGGPTIAKVMERLK